MEDTDWRPRICSKCGKSSYKGCRHNDCAFLSKDKENKETRMIKKDIYVWIRESGEREIHLIDDPVEIWKDYRFNKETDRIHRLGEEVEVKVTVEVKNKPVYRERGYDFNQKE